MSSDAMLICLWNQLAGKQRNANVDLPLYGENVEIMLLCAAANSLTACTVVQVCRSTILYICTGTCTGSSSKLEISVWLTSHHIPQTLISLQSETPSEFGWSTCRLDTSFGAPRISTSRLQPIRPKCEAGIHGLPYSR